MHESRSTEAVAIVGAGGIGTTLAQALSLAGVRIAAVASRTPAHARALSERLPDTPAVPLAQAGSRAPIVLLTVSDGAIEAACESIGPAAGSVVAHTSGSRDIGALGAAVERGALAGGFHPLAAIVRARALESMTPDECAAAYRGAVFAIEGAAGVQARLQPLATALGGRHWAIDGHDKPLYHLGASMLAAFSAGLAHLAWERMREAGAPQGLASAGVAHLLHTVAENVRLLQSPDSALTGPAVRGDPDGIRRQARAVRALSPEARALYRVHAEHSLALAVRARRIDERTAATLRDVIRKQLPDHEPNGRD